MFLVELRGLEPYQNKAGKRVYLHKVVADDRYRVLSRPAGMHSDVDGVHSG